VADGRSSLVPTLPLPLPLLLPLPLPLLLSLTALSASAEEGPTLGRTTTAVLLAGLPDVGRAPLTPIASLSAEVGFTAWDRCGLFGEGCTVFEDF